MRAFFSKGLAQENVYLRTHKLYSRRIVRITYLPSADELNCASMTLPSR
jgi:hypothetical protein